jgi:hypothetical protein
MKTDRTRTKRRATILGVVTLSALTAVLVLVPSLEANRIKPLRQTINGYTVTLYPLYADANRVALSYTVQSIFQDLSNVSGCETLVGQDPPCFADPVVIYGPGAVLQSTPQPTPTLRPYYEPQLSTSDGRILHWSREASSWSTDQPGSTIVFDTQQPPDNISSTLKLHFALPQAEFSASRPPGAGGIREIKGPFAFDFYVPVDPLRRVAEVNQTAKGIGSDIITIDKVIVTSHNVRVIWHLNGPIQSPVGPFVPGQPPGLYACCNLSLTVGGKSVTFPLAYDPPTAGDIVADASLMDEQGDWTISTSYFSTWTGNMYYPPKPGPSFHFTMPPPIR